MAWERVEGPFDALVFDVVSGDLSDHRADVLHTDRASEHRGTPYWHCTEFEPRCLRAMEVYVFPSKGQSSSQQSRDESACYTWAVQNTGTDPFQLQKEQQRQQQQTAEKKQQIADAGKGAGAKGAVGGAAAGALIGAIAHESVGAYAAWGALAGAVVTRRRTYEKQVQATQQVQQQSQQQAQATQQEIGNFKKAFSVGLEAKDYLVKY